MEEHIEPLGAPVLPRAAARGGGGRCGWPPQPRCSGSTSRPGDPRGQSGRGWARGDAGGTRRVRGVGEPPEDSRGPGGWSTQSGPRTRGTAGKGGSSGDAGRAWERADSGMRSSGGRGLAEAGPGAVGLRVAGGSWGLSSPSLPLPGGGARRSGRGLCAGAGARSRGPRAGGGRLLGRRREGAREPHFR